MGGRRINLVGATKLQRGDSREGGASLSVIKATEDGLSKKKKDAAKELLLILQSDMWNHPLQAFGMQIMYKFNIPQLIVD